MTFVLFAAATLSLVVVWNRWFDPVPLRVAGLFFLATCVYQGQTLFSSRVDVPAKLAYNVQPWKSLGRPASQSNTGIVFTQIAPWTEAARRSLRSGEWPHWNRSSGSGSPLLANQQTALLHPFTLLGLPLSVGKSFTLTACLRLFTVLFFTYVLFSGWSLHRMAAIMGALAYAFCTFHIVWLLFPLGLTTMMLPVALTGVEQLARRNDGRSFLLLAVALAATLLGGHPESALWVSLTTGTLALYLAAVRVPSSRRVIFLGKALGAALVAALLTAVFWLPTLRLLPFTTRYQLMRFLQSSPPERAFTRDWFLPLVAPNILGTPQSGTYTAPRTIPGALNDYGEIASGYAGTITLGLAILAFWRPQRDQRLFFVALSAAALLTISEAPVWSDFLAKIPMVSLTLTQRLRVLAALGTAALAAFALHDLLTGRIRRLMGAVTVGAATVLVAAIYLLRLPAAPPALVQVLWVATLGAALSGLLFVAALTVSARAGAIAAALGVLGELVLLTKGYNPPSRPEDMYPMSGALAAVLRTEGRHRMVAAGWSLIADTPSFYGLEDVKTTDPIANPRYLRLLRGYLRMAPDDYDQGVSEWSQPFFDYLNIRYIYVPPETEIPAARFAEIYRGGDGRVLENRAALPRYFFVDEVLAVEPSFDMTVALLKSVRDFRQSGVVDRVPAGIEIPRGSGRGIIRVDRYDANGATLEVSTDRQRLMVSSEPAWPGWEVKYKGKLLPTVTVNGAFIGAFVPPGDGKLRLQYRPPGFVQGATVSIVTLLFLGAITTWRARERGSVPHRSP